MGGASQPSLTVLASVRCLQCGAVYAKPTAGSTNDKNPGCPVCAYIGWIPVRLAPEPRRLRAAPE